MKIITIVSGIEASTAIPKDNTAGRLWLTAKQIPAMASTKTAHTGAAMNHTKNEKNTGTAEITASRTANPTVSPQEIMVREGWTGGECMVITSQGATSGVGVVLVWMRRLPLAWSP